MKQGLSRAGELLKAPAGLLSSLFFATRLHQFYLMWQVFFIPAELYWITADRQWRIPSFTLHEGANTLIPPWVLLSVAVIQFLAGIAGLVIPEVVLSETNRYGAGHFISVTSWRARSGRFKNLYAGLHVVLGLACIILLFIRQNEGDFLHPGDISSVVLEKDDKKCEANSVVGATGEVTYDFTQCNLPGVSIWDSSGTQLEPLADIHLRAGGRSVDDVRNSIHEMLYTSDEYGTVHVMMRIENRDSRSK